MLRTGGPLCLPHSRVAAKELMEGAVRRCSRQCRVACPASRPNVSCWLDNLHWGR